MPFSGKSLELKYVCTSNLSSPNVDKRADVVCEVLVWGTGFIGTVTTLCAGWCEKWDCLCCGYTVHWMTGVCQCSGHTFGWMSGYIVFGWGNIREWDHVADLDIGERSIIKWILKTQLRGHGLAWSGAGQVQVAGSCERGNGQLVYLNRGEFLD